MEEHPAIVFKDGPSGRRAALAFGPDVWEVIKFLREIDECGADAVAASTEMLRLTEAQVRLAMRYYAAHWAEVDEEIAQADEESEAAWRAAQHVPA